MLVRAITPPLPRQLGTYWVPGVNNLESFGRWAFAELTDVYAMEEDFEGALKAEFERLIDRAVA